MSMTPERRAALCEKHCGLVRKEATWHWKHGAGVRLGTADDVFQTGMLGLLRAIDGYDEARGTQFSTYATYAVRNAIQSACEDATLIRIPAGAQKQARAAGRELSTCTLETDIEAFGRHDLDTRVPDRWVYVEPENKIPDNWPETEHALRRLDERYRQVVGLRYLEGKTLKETGKALNISEERARQIEAGALARLRKFLGAEEPKPKRKTYLVTDPDGKTFEVDNLTKFCRDNELPVNKIFGLAWGYSQTCRGWRCRPAWLTDEEWASEKQQRRCRNLHKPNAKRHGGRR